MATVEVTGATGVPACKKGSKPRPNAPTRCPKMYVPCKPQSQPKANHYKAFYLGALWQKHNYWSDGDLRGRNCAKYSNILLDSLPAREAWLLRPPLETLGSPFCAFSKTGISWHGVHWNSCGQIPQLACGSRFTPLFAEFHSGISSIHRAPGLRFLAQKKASSLCLGWAYEI